MEVQFVIGGACVGRRLQDGDGGDASDAGDAAGDATAQNVTSGEVAAVSFVGSPKVT